MFPKALVEMALGVPNVLFAAFFAIDKLIDCKKCGKQYIDKVFGFTV